MEFDKVPGVLQELLSIPMFAQCAVPTAREPSSVWVLTEMMKRSRFPFDVH